jgi:hypothetical protein
MWEALVLETAQNRVIALWQSQACHQALCRTTARGMAEKPGQIGHPAGPSGIRAGDMGKAIAERLTFAALVLASPSCQAHPQRNRRSLNWQVLQMANLPAVTPGGSDITPGTPSAPLSDDRDCPAPIAALRTQELEAGSERPFGISHHATSASLRPSRQARPQSHELRQSRIYAEPFRRMSEEVSRY